MITITNLMKSKDWLTKSTLTTWKKKIMVSTSMIYTIEKISLKN